MKHFELKNFLGGAGGKKPKSPKPPVLQPPYLGDYKNVSSYSYSEVVDLISDGPIEGLTNKDGYILKPQSYLQGVYLNDVPVEVSSNSFVESSSSSTNDNQNQILITEQCLFDRIRDGIFGFAKNVSPNFKSKPNHFTIAQLYHNKNNWTQGLLQNIMFEPVLELCNQQSSSLSTYALSVTSNAYAWAEGCDWLYQYEQSNRIYLGETIWAYEGGLYDYNCRPRKPCSERRRGVVGRTLNYSAPIFSATCSPFYFESFFAATKFKSNDDSLPYLDDQGMALAIDRIVEILTTSSFSRFEKELLKEKLVDLGLDLGIPDGNFNYSVNKDQLKNLIKRSGSVKYPYYSFYTRSRGRFGTSYLFSADAGYKTYSPYLFYSVDDEDKIIDGYNQSLHEDLFINPKYKDIYTYNSVDSYDLGNIFAYNGKY